MPGEPTLCSFDSCPHAAHHGGLCHGHEKQRARGLRMGELTERIDGPGPKARWARVEAAAIRFADAIEAPASGDPKEDRRAYLREKHTFRQALFRYFIDKNGDAHLVYRATGEPAPMVKSGPTPSR